MDKAIKILEVSNIFIPFSFHVLPVIPWMEVLIRLASVHLSLYRFDSRCEQMWTASQENSNDNIAFQ